MKKNKLSIIISGVTGTGKTTVSRLLELELIKHNITPVVLGRDEYDEVVLTNLESCLKALSNSNIPIEIIERTTV